jgi:hypothetical protein
VSVEIDKLKDSYAAMALTSGLLGNKVKEAVRRIFEEAGQLPVYEQILAEFEQRGYDPNNLAHWSAALHGGRLEIRRSAERAMAGRRIKV